MLKFRDDVTPARVYVLLTCSSVHGTQRAAGAASGATRGKINFYTFLSLCRHFVDVIRVERIRFIVFVQEDLIESLSGNF